MPTPSPRKAVSNLGDFYGAYEKESSPQVFQSGKEHPYKEVPTSIGTSYQPAHGTSSMYSTRSSLAPYSSVQQGWDVTQAVAPVIQAGNYMQPWNTTLLSIPNDVENSAQSTYPSTACSEHSFNAIPKVQPAPPTTPATFSTDQPDALAFLASNSKNMSRIDLPGQDLPLQLDGVSCDLCPRTFSGDYARGNLQRHLKTVHSGTVLFCEVCNKQFRRSDARLQHYRKVHPKLEMPPQASRKI